MEVVTIKKVIFNFLSAFFLDGFKRINVKVVSCVRPLVSSFVTFWLK